MPVPYFISFRTYGTWLHGSREGSVDRDHNRVGGEFAPVAAARAQRERTEMWGEPFVLSAAGRVIVLLAIGGVCKHRRWTVFALHVRTNHVHVVVSTAGRPVTPERALNDFKAWSTRRLVEAGVVARGTPVWAYHGSTRYLNHAEGFVGACHYTMYEQDGDRFDREVWRRWWEDTEPMRSGTTHACR
jgi:REP element-mobilizing transposase RayT